MSLIFRFVVANFHWNFFTWKYRYIEFSFSFSNFHRIFVWEDASVRLKFRKKIRENKERNSMNFPLITFAQYCIYLSLYLPHQALRCQGKLGFLKIQKMLDIMWQPEAKHRQFISTNLHHPVYCFLLRQIFWIFSCLLFDAARKQPFYSNNTKKSWETFFAETIINYDSPDSDTITLCYLRWSNIDFWSYENFQVYLHD